MQTFSRYFLNFLLFTIVSFFLSDQLYCQQFGSIKGLVRDSASGEYIPYTNLMISGTKIGTNSSLNGSFILHGIPLGEQVLLISAVGYKQLKRKITINKNEISFINISLIPEAVELQGVTRTVERMKQVYETNISVKSISQEELKLIPMTLEKDVFRAMKFVPGVSTTSDVSSQFYVRGGAGDQNLVLYDNIAIYNPFHALGLFSIFNAEALKVSEVITGGFSPEYGGKLSSVINIVTKDGNRNKFGGNINLGLLSGQALFEGPLPGGSFLITYRKSYMDRMLKRMLGKEVPLDFYDFSGKLTYDITKSGKISVTYLNTDDEIKSGNEKDPNYNWANKAFGINLHSFIDKLLLTTYFSVSNFNGKVEPKLDTQNKMGSDVSTYNFDLKCDYLFQSNDLLSFGVSVFQNSMEYDITNYAKVRINKFDDINEKNIWARYKFSQIKNFIIDLGLRLNFVSIENNTTSLLEPRINFKYDISPELTGKASYSRMHQSSVTTANENDVIPLFEVWLKMQKPYEPETSDQFVLGVEGVISDFMDYSVSIFTKSLNNIMGYNTNKKSPLDTDFNFGSGTSSGIECFLKFDLHNYFGWATYTYSKSEKNINGISYPPRFDKTHSINALIGANLPYDLKFTLQWEFSSGMPFSPIVGYFDKQDYKNVPDSYFYDYGERTAKYGKMNSRRLPVYHRMDLSLSKYFAFDDIAFHLNFDLINVYDQKNIFYFDPETGNRTNMVPFMPSLSVGVEL